MRDTMRIRLTVTVMIEQHAWIAPKGVKLHRICDILVNNRCGREVNNTNLPRGVTRVVMLNWSALGKKN